MLATFGVALCFGLNAFFSAANDATISNFGWRVQSNPMETVMILVLAGVVSYEANSLVQALRERSRH